VNLLLGLRLGALLVLHPRFDLDTVMNEVAAKRISVFAGVPTMFTAMVNHPKMATLDVKSLKFCGSGGAPLPA
jgi:long-chain acyl-CoA synthetase